jgi:hypothetical protein
MVLYCIYNYILYYILLYTYIYIYYIILFLLLFPICSFLQSSSSFFLPIFCSSHLPSILSSSSPLIHSPVPIFSSDLSYLPILLTILIILILPSFILYVSVFNWTYLYSGGDCDSRGIGIPV